jgi:predicted peroxiredoxin
MRGARKADQESRKRFQEVGGESSPPEREAKMNRKRRAQKEHPPAAIEAAKTGENEVTVFVVFNGVRIAKRGKPNTPQARTWIPLEPGYEVLSPPDLSEVIIIHNGVRMH